LSNRRKIIYTPVKDDSLLEELRVGDVIYLTGIVVTARDEAHKRVIEEGIPPPIDLKGLALFHAGPIMVKTGDSWQCIAIGPTTSVRMEYYEDEFIEKTGIKIIIGKGGMGPRTADACRKHKVIYTIFPGGCGVLGASRVVKVRGVEWPDLGMPEALWILEVKEFGPLIVTIDTRGENLTEKMYEQIKILKEKISKEVVEKVRFH
jgi:tartrate/fumarate subfamily iron-sulfur-dependent hydro-lyase beta chain